MMKIPGSVRKLYEDLKPQYEGLQANVDQLIKAKKDRKWHYESRIKSEESFALKLETGRVPNPVKPDDLLACLVVVENHVRVADGIRLIAENFEIIERKPHSRTQTPLAPYNFDFDDQRLYVRWKQEEGQRPKGWTNLTFEIQVKTFLQHAWGLATHDLVYKTAEVNWATSRVAFQAKAMLENAELSINQAEALARSEVIGKEDKYTDSLRRIIADIKQRWDAEHLPSDLRRLAQNLMELCRTLQLDYSELWQAVDDATAKSKGAKTLNLSPYASVLESLIAENSEAFERLADAHPKARVFIAAEVDLPSLGEEALKKVIRPPSA